MTPTCTTDIYDDLTVQRLSFDVRHAPDQFEWSFRNPQLGHWFKESLERARPDVVHIGSGYLLGGAVPEAAFALNLPTVLTLHDYWYMCPLITLLRASGRICEQMGPPARCVWCSLVQKRRYRLPDKRLYGHLGNAFVKLSQSEKTARILGITPHLELIAARRAYLKRVLESIDVVISPSRFLIQKVREYGFQPRQLLYVPLGLDKMHLASPKPRHPSAKLRIGYLGQFAPHKGVHLLLAAFERLARHSTSCELMLHGNISDASPYERSLLKIGRHNPAITFAGPYPNSRVGQVLSDLDVIVVPSLWHEIGPTVIMEAHATRTPVVAARLGEMSTLVRHNENGLLFEPGSAASLAQQLQRLLDEPTLLPRLRAGIPPVPSIEEETATLVSLYKSLPSP